MFDQLTPPSAKLRAADLVLIHGAKVIEIEDQVRLTELEAAAAASGKHRK
jgi:hypothetical protein